MSILNYTVAAGVEPVDEFTNYRLVIAEKYRLFDIMMEANANSNRRLTTYIGAAVGLLITLALARPSSDLAIQQVVGFAAALLGGVTVAVAGINLGAGFRSSGNYDWDCVHEQYILLDTKKCFKQILSDLLDAIPSLEVAMHRRADAANLVACLLFVQALLTTIYWSIASLS